jgi:hypothetical protein
MVNATVKIDLSGLKKFESQIDRDLRGSGSGPIKDVLKQWGARYRAFVQKRFTNQGDGSWPALRTKRKRGDTGSAKLLRDTGTLFGALEPVFANKPGSMQKEIPFGVRVGYGGPSRHPGGKATIADIAAFHDQGAGNLPKRSIIVEPNATVTRRMAEDMERGLQRLADKSINAPR